MHHETHTLLLGSDAAAAAGKESKFQAIPKVVLQISSDMPQLQDLRRRLRRYDKPCLEARREFWEFPG